MPQLVEDFDGMRLCADASERAVLQAELEKKCWEHDRQLLAWRGMLSRLIDASEQSSGEARAGDLVIHIAQVHGMSLYWTTSLVLYSILRSISGPQADLPARTDLMHHARNLTRALGILLQPSAGLYGQQSAALPLEIALEYTGARSTASPESEALFETLKQLKDDSINGPTRVFEADSAHRSTVSGEMGIEW